jgi:hypothetical protein
MFKHFTTARFWEHYAQLPKDIRDLADKDFELLKADPKHPSLHLKKIDKLWSVRVGRSHRALAATREEGLLWFWVGSHDEYEKLLGTLKA